MEKNRRAALFSWLFLAALIALSAALASLQYRWIGEVSTAESVRLHGSLQANLNRLSHDFNAELTAACAALLAQPAKIGQEGQERDYAAHFNQWRESSRRARLIRSVSLAIPQGNDIVLRTLDPAEGVFHTVAWPPAWASVRDRLAKRWANRNLDARPEPVTLDSPALIDLPSLGRTASGGWLTIKELQVVLIEVNLDYLRGVLLPEMLQKHLGTGAGLDYQAEVVARDSTNAIVYRSDPSKPWGKDVRADASVGLFDVRPDVVFRRRASAPAALKESPQDAGAADRGRWQLRVRHRAGSLDDLVAATRMRNLAVTTGILLLMLAAVAALVQFTRRAQQLAELQMEFVAGVSHELRTPLSVMRTAGHNLRGRVAGDPARVQRYGALIEAESEKLTGIVEQVLRFANAKAGRVIAGKEPLSIATLIEGALESDRRLIEDAGCVVEKNIAPDLPPVFGDRTALKQALQNLIANAAKYGGNWIGISASMKPDRSGRVFEIRVQDHGPGIPRHEVGQIFEPFFRGKKAIDDQVHGTGLGLSLARRIVEAHGGHIRVHSEPGKGAEFVVRIPAGGVPEPEHELANSPG